MSSLYNGIDEFGDFTLLVNVHVKFSLRCYVNVNLLCLLHCVMFLLDVYTEYGKKKIESMFNRKAELAGEVTMKVNGHIVHTYTHTYVPIHIHTYIHPHLCTYRIEGNFGGGKLWRIVG